MGGEFVADRNDNGESLVGRKVDDGNPTPARVSVDHHGWLSAELNGRPLPGTAKTICTPNE